MEDNQRNELEIIPQSSQESHAEKETKVLSEKEQKLKNPRNKYYIRGKKARQHYLLNNHAAITAFIIALLNRHFNILVSYPIKISTKTLTFPRVRLLITDNNEKIEIWRMVEQRVEVIREEKKKYMQERSQRVSYETHYEIYHILNDMLECVEEYEIDGAREEGSGISGEYRIRVGTREWKWDEILSLGKKIIERMYGNRKAKETRRELKRGTFDDLIIWFPLRFTTLLDFIWISNLCLIFWFLIFITHFFLISSCLIIPTSNIMTNEASKFTLSFFHFIFHSPITFLFYFWCELISIHPFIFTRVCFTGFHSFSVRIRIIIVFLIILLLGWLCFQYRHFISYSLHFLFLSLLWYFYLCFNLISILYLVFWNWCWLWNDHFQFEMKTDENETTMKSINCWENELLWWWNEFSNFEWFWIFKIFILFFSHSFTSHKQTSNVFVWWNDCFIHSLNNDFHSCYSFYLLLFFDMLISFKWFSFFIHSFWTSWKKIISMKHQFI